MKNLKYILPVIAISSLNIYAQNESDIDPLKDIDPVSRIKILKQFDKNSDGVLDDEEKAEARKALKDKSIEIVDMKKKHVKDIMAKYDLNRDGVIDLQELESYLDSQRKLFESMQARSSRIADGRAQMLKKYDKNGDGIIDEKERATMRSDMSKLRESMLKKYDKDNKGYLSRQEREQMRKDNPNLPAYLYMGGQRGPQNSNEPQGRARRPLPPQQ